MSEPSIRWHVFADGHELESCARDAIADAAARAIDARGAFSLVLSGGSTPRAVYAGLAALPSPRWTYWHVYFGDERCLPRDDAGRNDTMARRAWLDRVDIPAAQIHAIPAELGPDAGALACARALCGVGPFDLVLLGLGEDGHTASLFPGQPIGAGPDAPDALAVHSAPKPPRERVTLSASRLRRARAAFVLVTGARKRAAVAALKTREDTMLHEIAPANGIDVYADADAAA